MRSAHLLLLIGLWLSVIIGGAPAVSQAVPLPGDPAPSLGVKEWLAKGIPDELRPVNGRLITIIEFWASWDPLSRVLLPSQDARQTDLRKQGVRFLTVAEEQPEDTQAYLRQARIQHLAVASDPAGEVLRSVLGTDTELPCPFAVILEEPTSGSGARLLWLGPVVNDADSWARCSGYQDDLDTVLGEVLAGTFDSAAARAAEVRRRECYELAAEAQANALAGHFDKAVPLAQQMQDRTWPPELARMRQDALTNIAFFLAEDAWSPVWQPLTAGQPFPMESCLPLLADSSRKARAALALQLAGTARELAKKDDAILLHITARAQAASGDLKGALETQRRALEAPRPHGQFLQMCWISEIDLMFAADLYGRILSGAPISDYEWADAPATLTSAQAVADLRQLHDILREYHPGYDDAAWMLTAAGSSWERHTEEIVRRLASQPTWSSPQFWELLTDEYLRVIPDKHTWLAIHGRTAAGQAYTNLRFPTMSQPPFFAEARVRQVEGKLMIAEAPDDLGSWRGAEVVGVPVIGSPTAAEPRRVYLFPTLPSVSPRDTKEYLVGMLADPVLETPPSSATVTVRTATGEQQVELPLHRGRTGLGQERGAAWTLREEPIPVLEVRTMKQPALAGLPATADDLRHAPLFVLDLRGNGGGRDDPASEWCARLVGHRVTMPGGICNIRAGETDSVRRWNSLFGETWWGRVGRIDGVSSDDSFHGRLVVLVDNNTGSAAEIFLRMASCIPRTLIVGENTVGCMTYGNDTQRFVLTESKLVIRFGWTKAAFTMRPFREGLGHFPDYWLDTDDPLRAVLAYVDTR